METLKYIISVLLILWGLIVIWATFYLGVPQFPFLTLLTLIGLIAGIFKNPNANTILFTSGCAWIIFSAETIGFALFFSKGNYKQILIGLIPLILSYILIISTKVELKWVNSPIMKILLFPIFLAIGLGSYVYKSTVDQLNCWYYLYEDNTYNVHFAKSPERTFEVELSSEELKNIVMNEGLQYEGKSGYYCPQTKIRVITRFSNIVSAEILSFNNSQIAKEIEFAEPTKIPLKNVRGKLEILKPDLLRVWN